MTPEHAVEERRLAVTRVRIGLDPAIEQEAHDVSLPIPGGVPQRHLASRHVGAWDELLHDVEPSDSSRPDHPDARAALDEVLRGFGASIGETGIDRIGTVAGEIGMLDLRTVIEQHLDHGELDAGFARWRARRHKAERRAAAAIHI